MDQEDTMSVDSSSTNSSTWSDTAKIGKISLHGHNDNGKKLYKMRFVTSNPEEFRQLVAEAKFIQESCASICDKFTGMTSAKPREIQSSEPFYDKPIFGATGLPPNRYPALKSYEQDSSMDEFENRGNFNINMGYRVTDVGAKDRLPTL